MARTLRFPDEDELPRGPERDFAAALFDLFKQARRPTLRRISSAISGRDDLPGTASTETVRRMLTGITVPAHWETVDVVVTVLCEMASIDPDQQVGDRYNDASSPREDVEAAWHQALDNPGVRHPPPSDPWAADPPF